MSKPQPKKGKKNRKWDRNRAWCKAYRERGQRERNKVRKVLKHILRYGATDHVAVHFYNNLPQAPKPEGFKSITPA